MKDTVTRMNYKFNNLVSGGIMCRQYLKSNPWKLTVVHVWYRQVIYATQDQDNNNI